MALLLESDPVRGARHAADRRAGALPLAALLIALLPRPGAAALAPDAGPQELAEGGWADLPAWWAEPGRPGYAPGVASGAGFPWTLAGLVLGSWSLAEPGRAPQGLPFPGVQSAHPRLSSYDSVSVGLASDGAWAGPGAGLASATGWPGTARLLRAARTRATFALVNGASGEDQNALGIERRDPGSWVRVEMATGRRGALGALGDEGRHLWGAAAGLERGAHRIEGAFAQRGEAGSLPLGLGEDAAGESGRLDYRFRRGPWSTALGVARGHDARESFGDPLVLGRSRRDAQETRASAELARERGPDRVAARVEWREAEVRRQDFDAFEAGARTLWGALRWTRRTGEGRLDLALGAGRNDAVSRVRAAPSLAYRVESGTARAGVVVQRVLDPAWADLAVSQAPFLQNTWSAGLDAGAGALERSHLGASLLLGRTTDRALAVRYPLTDVWLRVGLRRDPEPYDFALASAEATWRWRSLALVAAGYALSRDASPLQPRVDPDHGARLAAEAGVRLFQKDLGVRVRLEAEGVGPRESEFETDLRGEPVRLPGYATLNAAAIVTLADATITLRARNLEDAARAETWPDPRTGLSAVGPRRKLSLAMVWRLFN